jgi:hypothetical protein
MLHRLLARPGSRRKLVLLLAGFGLALYVSEMGIAWGVQQDEAARDQAFRQSRSTSAWRIPQSTHMVGQNIAAGAVGTLRFNPYDPIGMLNVHDMPVLPPERAYQLWCIDIRGKPDPATIFNVPMDSDGVVDVMISPPRVFHTYIRYNVTIEPAQGSETPTGPVVMASSGPVR